MHIIHFQNERNLLVYRDAWKLPNNSFYIRVSNSSDVGRLIEIESVFGDEAFSDQTIKRFVTNENVFVLCSFLKEIVAYAIVLYRKNSDGCRLYSIASVASGKGYGKLLLSSCINNAIINDKKWMSLEVRRDNTVAIKMYKKFGFTVDKVFENYYNDCDGLRMVLPLGR